MIADRVKGKNSDDSTSDRKFKEKGKREIVKQSDFPRLSLEKALRIAKCLYDHLGGKSDVPHQIATAIGLTPASSKWRNLCGASIAYGLTEGGYNAQEIKLSPLGRKIVAPEAEGEDSAAKMEAILKPRIMKAFFEKYDKHNFPDEHIAENVLFSSLDLPKERTSAAVDILKENGIFAGAINETRTGRLYVALESPTALVGERTTEVEEPPEDVDENIGVGNTIKGQEPKKPPESTENNRVFISHGKNRKIVEQLKPILQYGRFEPVISIEQETTAKPISDKVFDDMRSCSAAVIHIDKEEELTDREGNKHIKINDNVLIEIGAAIALYKKKFVLLVEKGVSLPSNLAGLYRCEYEGDKLDSDATMKLLKTFHGFSQGA